MPSPDLDWRTSVRRSAISAHEAIRRHPWAGLVLESRLNPGPARLRYLDAVVGVLRGAGFDTLTVARAFMALDSHTYGFTMQELAMPFDAASAPGVAEEMTERVFADRYPNLAAMAELAMSARNSWTSSSGWTCCWTAWSVSARRAEPPGRPLSPAISVTSPSRRAAGSPARRPFQFMPA